MMIDEMTEEVIQLAKVGDAKFLQLAKVLRELYDTLTAEPGLSKLKQFDDCLMKARISRRRAFYWIEIDRVYGPMKVSRKRLADVGWTKLSLMARYVEPAQIDGWLKVAETSTADELRAFLAGKDLPTHTMTFKLSEKQHGVIAGTLLANGAYLTGRAGIANKEAALVKVCRTIAKAWKAGVTW
jgi:hypothetical protein